MTIDFIDRAFLRRLAEPTPAPPSGVVVVVPAVRGETVAASPPVTPDDPVVRRLLASVPEQWARLADRVEAAFDSGDRIVAVTGRARGEGCSTIVRGLAEVLHSRGVGCRIGNSAVEGGAFLRDECGRPVLVDAGVWFPPGPLHRGRLARAAIGCDAALLVRRAERQPCPAHERALTAIGIHVLGEVVTFAAPADGEAISV